MPTALGRLEELAARYGLAADAPARLAALLDALRHEPVSLTTVRDPAEAADVHVADSLVALELAEVRDARRVADLGAGAGFPGIVLAVALPAASVTLVESVGRKAAWLEKAIQVAAVPNASVVRARAEAWPEGMGAHDLVTARALASLPVLLEYAAPLLSEGGAFVAFKGRRNAEEERDAAHAGELLGLEQRAVTAVEPWAAAGKRHLHLWSKVRPTPRGYPRREGMARKRPLRAST